MPEAPAIALPTMPARRALHGENVHRIMVRQGLTLLEVVDATGLDERTIRSILRGTTRPHARTLHKLAAGLGIDADDLFVNPIEEATRFDSRSNPAAARIVRRHPELFADWTPADFQEYFSRVGVGGELTEEGALAYAAVTNRRRELLTQVAVILESAESEHLREIVDMLYRRVTVSE
ncbi:MAG: helix-turn-helix transcriptional regulator [Planctomycetaceae bacterium]|uniref:Helix-turn-helix domain protein n=1 Tax=Lacipirellula limnantheis TaxID=2528024 RepID=A0A517U5U8_9BACT|nr:helix-turn-helix transcriptional regulator [Lacipirellula limnantheis]MBL9163346.1 helix-turn-helix transcriptional regulator [Planctomycetaceae bacterium]QDT76006.1 Helix-turn-helix domain protein [Lacipirellula limnantheis]